MITDLRLRNFGRYDDVDLLLPEDAQLIAITGPNGAGKSTLATTAVLWGLYGETPKNIRQDQLVRRGAEYEGMDVEIGFTVGGVNYQIRRRWRDGAVSAVLYGDGTPLCESPSAVNDAIEHIFGMDAASFKLATVARQKELAGLATMTATQRVEKLSRLLRLDAIKVASKEVRKDVNKFKERINGLPAMPDTDELESAVTERELLVGELETARSNVAEQVRRLDDELATSTDVESRWQAAVSARVRAEATVESAESEVARLKTNLGNVAVPDVGDAPARGRDEVEADRADLERKIARAETAAESAEYLDVIAKDHNKATGRLGQIDAWFAEHGTFDELTQRKSRVDEEVETAKKDRLAANDELGRLRGIKIRSSERAEQLERRRRELDGLDAVCPTCEQTVDDDHRHQVAGRLEDEISQARGDYDTAGADAQTAQAALEAAEAHLAQVEAKASQLAQLVFEADRLRSERADVTDKVEVTAAQLANAPDAPEDLKPRYARRQELAAELKAIETYEQAVRDAAAAAQRRDELAAQLREAEGRLTGARETLAAAEPDEDLAEAHESRQKLLAQRQAEAEALSTLTTEHAVAKERAASARRDLEQANKLLERRRGFEREVQVNGLASDVLNEAHTRISGQIRPSLEGAIAELLARMSNGRFTDVELTDSYALRIKDVTVDSDGNRREGFYDLNEFSGGEQDLIALAMRLAIAGVIAERHGTSGPGFVILDETFGSQDADRRSAILAALRALRGHYGQILLISHVAGIDACADLVLNVAPSADSSSSTVDVL